MKCGLAIVSLAAATAFGQGVSTTTAVPPMPSEAAVARNAVMAKLAPSAMTKVQRVAATVSTKLDETSSVAAIEATLRDSLVRAFPDVKLGSGDVATLSVVVVAAVAEAGEVEVKDGAAEIAKIAAQQADLKSKLTTSPDEQAAARPGLSITTPKTPAAVVKAPPPLPSNASAAAMQQRLTQLSGLTEANQLRMQMVRTRHAKLLEVLTHLMKKEGEGDSVLERLK